MSKNNTTSGFTLVELVVVIPMVIAIIGVIIGMMISLVGNVVSSNSKTQAIYDTQSSLNQIEQDAYVSTAFLATYTPPSPQGKDNAVQAFSSGNGSNKDIIFNIYATNKSPLDTNRRVVYFANQPETCSGTVLLNTPFAIKVVYFLKTVGGVQSLYRRTMVPTNNQNTGSPDAQTTCTKPWQRGSCESANYASSPLCTTKDMLIAANVSSMVLGYFNKANPAMPITDPTLADSLKITITIQKKAGGDTISQPLSLSVSRSNN